MDDLNRLREENHALRQVIEPIQGHVRAELRKRADELKKSDHLGWYIGEMLERACIFLDAEAIKEARQRGALWT